MTIQRTAFRSLICAGIILAAIGTKYCAPQAAEAFMPVLIGEHENAVMQAFTAMEEGLASGLGAGKAVYVFYAEICSVEVS